MTKNEDSNQRCPLCNHTDFSTVQNAEPPYEIIKCTRCGMVFVSPFPPEQDLVESYSEGYYKEWISVQRRKRTRMWERRFKGVQQLTNKGASILDIGCGDGSFLELAAKNGYKVSGTEFSPYASQYVSKRLGVTIQNKSLLDAGFQKDSFDFISMWHVLEHVSNPVETLKEIKRILKKNGHFIVAVPNYNNLFMRTAYRIFKGKELPLFSVIAKEQHLFHYTPDTLRLMLNKAGFDIEESGPDVSAIETSKQIVDNLALIFYSLFRIKAYGAIKIIATPSDS